MLKKEHRNVIRDHLDLKFQILHLYQYPTLRNENNHLDLSPQQAKKKEFSAATFFNTIMYLPSNNKVLSLIVLAMILPDARGELVYDCTTQKNKVHSFSMVEVKECPKFETQYDNGTLAKVQIISKSTQRFIQATKVRFLLIHSGSLISIALCTITPLTSKVTRCLSCKKVMSGFALSIN